MRVCKTYFCVRKKSHCCAHAPVHIYVCTRAARCWLSEMPFKCKMSLAYARQTSCTKRRRFSDRYRTLKRSWRRQMVRCIYCSCTASLYEWFAYVTCVCAHNMYMYICRDKGMRRGRGSGKPLLGVVHSCIVLMCVGIRMNIHIQIKRNITHEHLCLYMCVRTLMCAWMWKLMCRRVAMHSTYAFTCISIFIPVNICLCSCICKRKSKYTCIHTFIFAGVCRYINGHARAEGRISVYVIVDANNYL